MDGGRRSSEVTGRRSGEGPRVGGYISQSDGECARRKEAERRLTDVVREEEAVDRERRMKMIRFGNF